MKIVLLITVLESLLVALLMVLWRFRRVHSKMLSGAVDPSTISAADNPIARSRKRPSSDDSRWAFINKWRVEPQADDRRPMLGAVAYRITVPSVRRSIARRRHQAMYKEWSKTSHE